MRPVKPGGRILDDRLRQADAVAAAEVIRDDVVVLAEYLDHAVQLNGLLAD
nr:hypothetical protein [Bradyrhizobium elkanii]